MSCQMGIAKGFSYVIIAVTTLSAIARERAMEVQHVAMYRQE